MGLLMFFVSLCIFFEVYARYSTYVNFTHKYQRKVEQVQYTTWNPDRSEWEQTDLKDLREGQIILVNRYLESDPRLNPTTLLPIAYASKNRYVASDSGPC